MLGFSEILKVLRKKRGFTQAELAEAMGISQPTICEWESGVYPQFENLMKLSDILDISLDELMGKKENPEISKYYAIEKLSQNGTLTLEELRKENNLSVDEFAEMLGIARNTLINWEKNGLPNFDKYKKIFQYYNLSNEQILELK